jgi:hypothetical protein
MLAKSVPAKKEREFSKIGTNWAGFSLEYAGDLPCRVEEGAKSAKF